ncbi:MAG: PAS domain-containing sensor histidine kinase [Candidatus Thermoplasmatota archaeon]
MPAKSPAGIPDFVPGTTENERDLLAGAARASLPPILLLVGAVYVVFSGTIFFYLSGTEAAWLWAATAAVGVLLVGAGLWVRQTERPLPNLHVGATAVATLVVTHALVVLSVTADVGQTSYLLMLLAGAGYFVLLRWGLAVVDAVAVLGWVAATRSIGVDPLGPEGGLVAAGLIIGAIVHTMRRRSIANLAGTRRAVQGTLVASEERFRSLAETAKDAILLLDGDGRLTYLNPSGMALFGLEPKDIGRPAGHLLGAPGNEPGNLVGTTELQALRKDGSTFPAELSLAATQHEDGAVVYTGVLRDTTQRKKAEEATHAASSREAELETLRKMNSFKTQFLNTAAHELNTPLTPLRLQLHLLKAESMGALNERQTKAVALLDRNVTRLSGLVGEILEVARLQSGRVRLTPVPVEVDAVVDEVIESFNETAHKVGVGLAFEGTPGLHAFADRNRFTQILFNLVSNALKFTPSGGAVTVDARQTNHHIEVQVRDTGLGLTDEQMGRLFQPFTQVHDPMAVTATGTGLGLYICKGLVEAQGGHITVKSGGPGRGSTFSFTLPVADPGQTVTVGIESPSQTLGPLAEDAMVRRLRELI